MRGSSPDNLQQSDPDTESLHPVLPDPWYPPHPQPEFPPDPAESLPSLRPDVSSPMDERHKTQDLLQVQKSVLFLQACTDFL